MGVPAGVDTSFTGWSAYGLGLRVMRVDGRTLAGHGGSMPGFLVGLSVDREEGTGAVMLANTTTGLDPLVPRGLLADLRTAEPRTPTPADRRRRRCRSSGSAPGSGARRPTCCARCRVACCTSARWAGPDAGKPVGRRPDGTWLGWTATPPSSCG